MISDRQLAELIVKHGKPLMDEPPSVEEVMQSFGDEPETMKFLRGFANDLWQMGYDAAKVEYL